MSPKIYLVVVNKAGKIIEYTSRMPTPNNRVKYNSKMYKLLKAPPSMKVEYIIIVDEVKSLKKIAKSKSVFDVNLKKSQIVVYHGTDANFKDFKKQFLGSAHGTAPINLSGFSFTDKRKVAKTFGKNILKVKLQINKPFIMDARGENYSTFKYKLNEVLDKVDRKKYDAIIIKNYEDAGIYGESTVSNHYIPFNEKQIFIVNKNEKKDSKKTKSSYKPEPNIGISPYKDLVPIMEGVYKGQNVSKSVQKDAEKLFDAIYGNDLNTVIKIGNKYENEYSKSKKRGTTRDRFIPVDSSKVRIFNLSTLAESKMK